MAHLKYILYIFLPVLLIFAMSHNAFAVVSDEVQWVNSGYNNINVYGNGTLSCQTNCDFVVNNNTDVSVGVNTIQFGIQSGQYYQNQIIQFNLTFWKVSSNTSIHANFNSLQVVDNASIKFYDLTFDNIDSNTFIAHLYLRVVNDVYISNRVQVEGVGSLFMFLLQPTERVSANSWTLWQIADTAPILDTSGIISAIQAQPNYQQSLNNIRNDIQNVQDSIEDINGHNEKEEEAVEDIENQSTDDVDVGDQSGMTNAVGVVSGIFNQIGSVQATDCNFTANFGHLNLGNLNFCTGKENFPFIINFVSSIFTLIVVVGTILILVRQILGLYDWARKD